MIMTRCAQHTGAAGVPDLEHASFSKHSRKIHFLWRADTQPLVNNLFNIITLMRFNYAYLYGVIMSMFVHLKSHANRTHVTLWFHKRYV